MPLSSTTALGQSLADLSGRSAAPRRRCGRSPTISRRPTVVTAGDFGHLDGRSAVPRPARGRRRGRAGCRPGRSPSPPPPCSSARATRRGPPGPGADGAAAPPGRASGWEGLQDDPQPAASSAALDVEPDDARTRPSPRNSPNSTTRNRAPASASDGGGRGVLPGARLVGEPSSVGTDGPGPGGDRRGVSDAAAVPDRRVRRAGPGRLPRRGGETRAPGRRTPASPADRGPRSRCPPRP